MKLHLLILLGLIIAGNTFGQKAKIDIFCRMVDSSLINENIILHSVRHKTDFDAANTYDHYYIDTVKGKLVKSIYQFSFEGDGEYLEFYYRGVEIIRINAKQQLDKRKFAGSFYFKSNKLVAHTGGEISPGKIVFDLEKLLKTGNGYMNKLPEIIESLKNKNPIQ